MHGVWSTVPSPLHRNLFYSRLPMAVLVQLPNMLHPCGAHPKTRSSDMDHIRSTVSSRDFLSQQSFSIWPHSSGQTSTTAAEPAFTRNPTERPKNAWLPYLQPGVGRLCAWDQTRCGIFPERVHRQCHHQMWLPARRWGWTCHTSLPFRPLHGCLLVTYYSTMQRPKFCRLWPTSGGREAALTFVNIWPFSAWLQIKPHLYLGPASYFC